MISEGVGADTNALKVKIAFDRKAKVWVTWDSQVPGLTAIDNSKEGLIAQIEAVTPELLKMSERSTRLPHGTHHDVMIIEQMPPDLVELESPHEVTGTYSLTFR